MSDPIIIPRTLKMAWTGLECVTTCVRPVMDLTQSMLQNRIATGVALCAIAALVLCFLYIKTDSMLDLKNHISHFFSNPIHVKLISILGGIVYLIIGRELVNKSKIQKEWKDTPCTQTLLNRECHGKKEKPDLHAEVYQKRRKRFAQNRLCKPQRSKKRVFATQTMATITLPLVRPLQLMYENPRITSIACCVILTLVLCTLYAQTKPMQNFRHALSKAYHATADFVSHPVYATLLGIIGGITYIGIGRELLNGNKIDLLWDDEFSNLEVLWGVGNRKKILNDIGLNEAVIW